MGRGGNRLKKAVRNLEQKFKASGKAGSTGRSGVKGSLMGKAGKGMPAKQMSKKKKRTAKKPMKPLGKAGPLPKSYGPKKKKATPAKKKKLTAHDYRNRSKARGYAKSKGSGTQSTITTVGKRYYGR